MILIWMMELANLAMLYQIMNNRWRIIINIKRVQSKRVLIITKTIITFKISSNMIRINYKTR